MSYATYLVVDFIENLVEGFSFPLLGIVGILPLVSVPCRNDVDSAVQNKSVGVGHEGFRAEVNPPLDRVGDNGDFS